MAERWECLPGRWIGGAGGKPVSDWRWGRQKAALSRLLKRVIQNQAQENPPSGKKAEKRTTEGKSVTSPKE